VFRIAIREFGIGTGRREIACALRIVEGEARVAEVAMQRRPERVMIMDYRERRQPRRERVEAVADQRRDDDRVDAERFDDVGEQRAIPCVNERGVGDRQRQRNATKRRPRERAP